MGMYVLFASCQKSKVECPKSNVQSQKSASKIVFFRLSTLDFGLLSNPSGDERTSTGYRCALVQSCARGSYPCRRRIQWLAVVIQYSSSLKNLCRETPPA